MNTVGLILAVCLTCPGAAIAQDARVDVDVIGVAHAEQADPAIQASAPEPAPPGGAQTFARDVAHDYRNFFSWTNAAWLGAGGLASLAVHPADEPIQRKVLESEAPLLPGGNLYGSQLLQVPLAMAWWVVGHAAGSDRDAAAGRDLLRAQISVFSWTYAIKYAADRTRPNGDPRSFPSGHASTSFATAMVLQEHYGWKLGVPAFAAATYTVASRITENQHWLSDVVFGAALGMVSGRTVTVRMRDTRVTLAPLVVPGGGGISFSSTR
jgi:membrane-associated phospholipid phosphatase